MNVELHKKALDLLQERFDIVFATDCRAFDTDPIKLQEWLQPFRHREFAVNEKILLVHMDTDYYDPLLPTGLIPANTVRIFLNLDISLHTLLFVTNHFGIGKEFDRLLADHHPADRPQVIETLLTPNLLAENYDFIKPPEFDQIEKSAICMMQRARSHRVAFYNFLCNNNLLSKVAVSQYFNA